MGWKSPLPLHGAGSVRPRPRSGVREPARPPHGFGFGRGSTFVVTERTASDGREYALGRGFTKWPQAMGQAFRPLAALFR